jgi:hypothetical protein
VAVDKDVDVSTSAHKPKAQSWVVTCASCRAVANCVVRW